MPSYFDEAFARVDGIYNGIVFKKNDILDSPAFKVDDDQFSRICKRRQTAKNARQRTLSGLKRKSFE